MELLIHFTALPEGLTLEDVKADLAGLLEDERVNPKYGILTVKGYLQKAKFAPDTTIELAGVPVGIYE